MTWMMYFGFGMIITSPLWLYLLAKINPKISRALHKEDCKCNVCYPITKGESS
jgi:hypothetical protein